MSLYSFFALVGGFHLLLTLKANYHITGSTLTWLFLDDSINKKTEGNPCKEELGADCSGMEQLWLLLRSTLCARDILI